MTADEVEKEKSRSLSRREILQTRSAQVLGSIGRQPGFTAVALISRGEAVMVFACVVWGQATRMSRVAGVLVPRTGRIALAAPQLAVPLGQRVQEGQMVGAQQVLFLLRTDRTTAQGNTAVLVAQSLAQRRDAMEAEHVLQVRRHDQLVGDRLRGLGVRRQSAKQETELAQHRIELTAWSAKRYAQLRAGGRVAHVQAQQKQEKLIDLRSLARPNQHLALALAHVCLSVQVESVCAGAQRDRNIAQLDQSLAALDRGAAETQPNGKTWSPRRKRSVPPGSPKAVWSRCWSD
jgi:membrane fusion protein